MKTTAVIALALVCVFHPLAQSRDAEPTTPAGQGPILPRLGPQQVRFVPSVMVPMKDGVRLSTDLYLPRSQGRFPVILIRTPYDKNRLRPVEATATNLQRANIGPFFASHGFAVAVQDMRGRWESEGRYTVFKHERSDFVDTVGWLEKQDWSTGAVGTYGCSYLGETQIAQAATRHPKLKAMIPQAAAGGFGSAGGRYRQFALLNGGARELGFALGWFSGHGSSITLRPPEWARGELWTRFAHLFSLGPRVPEGFVFKRDVATLPVQGMMDNLGLPPNDWNDIASQPPGSRYWKERDYLREGEQIDVPALHVNSWYDYGAGDTIHQFWYFQRNAVTPRAAENQYLIIGGGLHCTNESIKGRAIVGERDIGDPRFDHWSLYLAWFKRWLKDDADALQGIPRVQYYLLGKNEWRTAETFPVPGTKQQTLFLSSRDGANSLWGDGVLTAETGAAGHDTFTYDPGNPVPTLGGPLCCVDSDIQPEGAFDQRRIEARNDVLVYSTPPLREPLTVVGPVRLVLYVSSSAKDTDFTAKLLDVYPDGRAFNLSEGILRARYREGQEREVFMAADSIYRLEIDLQAIGNWFPQGHRIRVEVSSSNFPRFDRNLNTGGANFNEASWIVARNVVHFGAKTPSQLLLPVVPND